MRAAASSIASGRPSRRWQIATTAAAFASVRANVGCAALRPRDEEAHRLGGSQRGQRLGSAADRREAQRRDRIGMLAGETEQCPAGGQDRQVGASGKELRHRGCGRQQVLEVVEEDQHLAVVQDDSQPILEWQIATFMESEPASQRGQDERRIGDCAQ